MKKNYKFTLILSALFVLAGNLDATVWTWVGSTGGNGRQWNRTANWTNSTGATSITSTDTIWIKAGAPSYPELGGTTSFNMLILEGGTIDIGGNTLTIKNTTKFTGGTIVNGATNRVDNLNMKDVIVNFNGKITIPDDVQLNVSGSITFINGIIALTQLPGYAMNMYAGSSSSGANTNSFIDGRIIKYGNTPYTFPTGDGTNFAPISISAPQTVTDAFTAEYFNYAYNMLNVNTSLDHVSITEHWILNRTSGLSNVTVTLSYQNPRSGQITSMSDLRVARYNGVSWTSEGGTASGNVTSGTIISSTVTDFSPFTVGSSSTLNPLPVKLVDLHTEVESGTVKVIWSSTEDAALKSYTIERSMDGLKWETISDVGSIGTQGELAEYQGLDLNPGQGNVYYRLRFNELNATGNVQFSPIVTASISNDQLNVYPNPAIGSLYVWHRDGIHVSLFDASGKRVAGADLNQGLVTLLDINSLAPGIYTVCIETMDKPVYSKLMVR